MRSLSGCLQILFGLVLLAVPLALLVLAGLGLAALLPFVPVFLPLTTLLVIGAVAVAWVRWKRRGR